MADQQLKLFTVKPGLPNFMRTGEPTFTLPFDDVLKALTGDWTREPPDVVAISGLLGQATGDPASGRVYLTKNLDDYVEFALTDVKAWAQRPDGWGWIVWLARDASLRHVWKGRRDAAEIFLAGQISETYMPQAQQALGGAWAGLPAEGSTRGGPCSP